MSIDSRTTLRCGRKLRQCRDGYASGRGTTCNANLQEWPLQRHALLHDLVMSLSRDDWFQTHLSLHVSCLIQAGIKVPRRETGGLITVAARASRSRNVALACMGPRIYIRGIASAMRDTDECESFMYYRRENSGRVAS